MKGNNTMEKWLKSLSKKELRTWIKNMSSFTILFFATDEDKQKIDDGTAVTEQKPTGIKIVDVDNIESKDQDKDIETAELDLRYEQPVKTKIVDPIVVSPKGKEKKDEIKTEKNQKLKTSKTQPELVDAKSIKIKEGDKKEDSKIKGLKIEKVGDVVSKEDKEDKEECKEEDESGYTYASVICEDDS